MVAVALHCCCRGITMLPKWHNCATEVGELCCGEGLAEFVEFGSTARRGFVDEAGGLDVGFVGNGPAEVPLIYRLAQDAFVEFLQQAEAEIAGQEVAAHGCGLEVFADDLTGTADHLVVVEAECGQVVGIYPLGSSLVRQFFVVVFCIDEGIVNDGDDTLGGVALHIAKGCELLHIDMVQPCKLAEDALGCRVEVFVFLHKSADERELPLCRLVGSLVDEDLEPFLFESENGTIYGYIEPWIFRITGYHSVM